MKKSILLILCVGLLCMSSNAFALDFGTQITIYDDNPDKNAVLLPANEDGEVEPGMQWDQRWDLEGVFFDDDTSFLTFVGGYNFITYGGYAGGDIFIDVNGDAKYGDIHRATNGNKTVAQTFGYDYVFDLNLEAGNNSYTIYKLTQGTSSTITAFYGSNYGSNPWRYAPTDNDTNNIVGNGSYTLGTVSDTGFKGATHYALTVDMSLLMPIINADPDFGFLTHYTMECGNDNIIGYKPVPEPATMLLLGSGLFALAIFGRRKLAKK